MVPALAEAKSAELVLAVRESVVEPLAAPSTGADEVVFEGMCASIRHHQNVVDAAGKGSECGIVFENFNDFAVNDKIECVEMYKVPPDVEDVPGGGFRVVADRADATQSA